LIRKIACNFCRNPLPLKYWTLCTRYNFLFRIFEY